ncbi:MAG: hypothetical protein ACRC76_02695 [Proteocatella sp.]
MKNEGNDSINKEMLRKKELENIVRGIKRRIYELILENKEKEALRVILQLQSIAPEDNEIKDLKYRIILK